MFGHLRLFASVWIFRVFIVLFKQIDCPLWPLLLTISLLTEIRLISLALVTTDNFTIAWDGALRNLLEREMACEGVRMVCVFGDDGFVNRLESIF